MAARTITGTVHYPGNDLPWVGGIVKFRNHAAFVAGDKTYPIEEHSFTLDASGQFTATLAVPDTGTVEFDIKLPSNEVFYVGIGDGAATTLEALLA